MEMKKFLKKLAALAAAAVMCVVALPCADISAANLRTVTVNTEGSGTAYSSATALAAGESYTLTAAPNPGAEFDHWEISDVGNAAGVKMANIAFILDTSGSMSSDIKKVKNNLESFILALSNQGITANIGIITYEKSATFHTYADGSNWSTDTAGAVSILEKILKKGTSGSYERTTEALKYLINSDDTIKFPSSINNYVFILTDEDCEQYSNADPDSTDQGKYPLSKYADIFAANNVKVAVVAEDDKECHKGIGKEVGYDDIVAKTSGTYIDIDTPDYYKLMLDYAQFISETVITVRETYYTNPCTAVMPDCDVIARAVFKTQDAPAQQSYKITVVTEGSGTASASKTSALPGELIKITAAPGYNYMLDSITLNNSLLKGNSFVMPAADVTVYVKFTEDFSTYVAMPHSYIFSYNESGDHIVTNSNRKYTYPEATTSVTVKLGADYAGKSCVLYTGRESSGGTVVEEAVLDENGRATFSVAIRKNFHLVVSD